MQPVCTGMDYKRGRDKKWLEFIMELTFFQKIAGIMENRRRARTAERGIKEA